MFLTAKKLKKEELYLYICRAEFSIVITELDQSVHF